MQYAQSNAPASMRITAQPAAPAFCRRRRATRLAITAAGNPMAAVAASHGFPAPARDSRRAQLVNFRNQ